jgi:filamentous hemagglutinin family protein
MNRFIFFASSLFVSALFANPQGFDLVAGSANPPFINPQGTMVVESSGRAIIDWTSFSIAQGEWIHFDQGGQVGAGAIGSAVLNRVVGNDLSAIYGQLTSNAAIYLINPNGILIGPKGFVEPSGFLASTFDILNQDFLNDAPLRFFGNSVQAVLNEGIVNCPQGNIILCGLSASSTGVLNAPNGYVQIRSGEVPVFLKPRGTKHIYVKLDPTEIKENESSATKMVSMKGETFLVAP